MSSVALLETRIGDLRQANKPAEASDYGRAPPLPRAHSGLALRDASPPTSEGIHEHAEQIKDSLRRESICVTREFLAHGRPIPTNAQPGAKL